MYTRYDFRVSTYCPVCRKDRRVEVTEGDRLYGTGTAAQDTAYCRSCDHDFDVDGIAVDVEDHPCDLCDTVVYQLRDPMYARRLTGRDDRS